MPRFALNGPVVPDSLVQELEDDRVVFFCGAGISQGAGLPSYTGLVKHCFEELDRTTPDSDHEDWYWPDRMLGSLESVTSPEDVRRVVVERLSQDSGNLDFHRAILRLSRLRQINGYRLLSTNFDLLFEKAKNDLRLGYEYHSGPILPLPKNDRVYSWRSLVYLHGRMQAEDEDNSHLVLTSADFGRAYLTEGWAARFVANLFSNFTVVFVGYSLNDPVLRYMTDAFSAEKDQDRTGLNQGVSYIFVPHDRKNPDAAEYENRKLHPIFYDKSNDHEALRSTFIEWARARDDYLSNVELIISQTAQNPPETLDPSATNNLLWAIIGRPGDLGRGARIFSRQEPLPSIQWLYAIERREDELLREHESASATALERGWNPPPLPVCHLDQLISPRRYQRDAPLTRTAEALADWLMGHLSSTDLTNWVIEKLIRGGLPHHSLRMKIRAQLDAEPRPPDGFCSFWRIVSSEGPWALDSPTLGYRVADIPQLVVSNRHAQWARQELMAILRPHVALGRSFYSDWEEDVPLAVASGSRGDRLAEIAEFRVELAGEAILPSVVLATGNSEDREAFWAQYLEDLSMRLKEVLELFAVAGEADQDVDPSAFERPSIVPHDQNHHHVTWSQLFDFMWDGWRYLDKTNPEASRRIVCSWRGVPFLAFRRLSLAALHHSTNFTESEKLSALIDE